ncbi:hypothetical protein FRC03_008588 [Tulasnella sp. 419]|nr:hypothetical protein FRC02_005906 [Tulasnella sp. 418]KAG8958955.1 hypothetical protein FRC03_008588 [Tulasnella sp. 419]
MLSPNSPSLQNSMYFNAIFLRLFYGGVIFTISVMAKPIPEIAKRTLSGGLQVSHEGSYCYATMKAVNLPPDVVASIRNEWADYESFKNAPIFEENRVARDLKFLKKEDYACAYSLKARDGTQVAIATYYTKNDLYNYGEEVAKATAPEKQGDLHGSFEDTSRPQATRTWIISRLYVDIYDTVLYKNTKSVVDQYRNHESANDPTQRMLTLLRKFAKAYGESVANVYSVYRLGPREEVIHTNLIQWNQWKPARYDVLRELELQRQATQAMERLFHLPPGDTM